MKKCTKCGTEVMMGEITFSGKHDGCGGSLITVKTVDGWIRCNGYEDIPEGDWYVIEEKVNPLTLEITYEQHMATVGSNSRVGKVVVIGHYFAFDLGRIRAYRKAHDIPPEEELIHNV